MEPRSRTNLYILTSCFVYSPFLLYNFYTKCVMARRNKILTICVNAYAKHCDFHCYIFLSSSQNIVCGYSLNPPHLGFFSVYPQAMFRAEIRKTRNIAFGKHITPTSIIVSSKICYKI